MAEGSCDLINLVGAFSGGEHVIGTPSVAPDLIRQTRLRIRNRGRNGSSQDGAREKGGQDGSRSEENFMLEQYDEWENTDRVMDLCDVGGGKGVFTNLHGGITGGVARKDSQPISSRAGLGCCAKGGPRKSNMKIIQNSR